MSGGASDVARRRFLELAAAGVAALCGACSSSSSSVGPAAVGDVAAGKVADLPVGVVRAVGDQPVAIGRDAGGVYAMTLTCTHQGCNMAVDGGITADAVICSCHGSRFDLGGKPTAGPADSPLAHFAVTVDGAGALTIHGGTQVDASARLKV